MNHEDEKTVLREMEESFIAAWETGEYQGEVLGFANFGQLFSVFTPKRWQIIETLKAMGPSSIRGLARTLDRDVKRVHEDVAILLEEGVIERTDDRKLIVPFVSVRFEAIIGAAE